MIIKLIVHSISLSSLLLVLVACGGGGDGGSGGSSSTPDQGAGVSAAGLPEASYYSIAKPLLDRYCTTCHGAEGVAAGIAPFLLDSYTQVAGKKSALVYVIETGSMPPVGYAGMDASDAELFLSWLESGAPEGDVSQTPQGITSDNFTYHRDVRPIVEEKCAVCHVQGGIAPFPLQDYENVKAVAAAALFSIENGTMPPWPPTDGYTDFDHPMGLTQEQGYIISDWLAGDMAAGNPSDYVAPAPKEIRETLTYNIIEKLPQPYTPTLRPDDHRCFAIPWPEDEFTYVIGVDVTPDQIDEVHHVIVSIGEPEDAATYYAADGEDGRPGWFCLGMGGVDGAPFPRQIGGWVPGAGREPSPSGLGTGVKPGSVMIVQMHYNTVVAEPKPDQSTIRVATSDEVERPARGALITDPRWLSAGNMPIPAGDPAASHEIYLPAFLLARAFGEAAGISASDSWVLHQGFLHMHGLGTSARTTLYRTDGTKQVILDIRDWDFNWQGTYNFVREMLIQPGDYIKLECTWDNSQENQEFVDGVQQTSRYTEWGDGTGDEMCLMSILMSGLQEGYDYSYSPTVYIESPTHMQRFAPGDLVPLRLILNNFDLHDPGEHDHEDAQMHDGTNHSGADDDHSGVYEGHYYVYLDSDDDDAEHLTAWDDSYYFALPDDIESGKHTLRVNLRGPDHHALGIEKIVEFEVTDAPSEQSISLVDVDAWNEQDADQDSLADHRPSALECPSNSWYNEDGALEAETGYCNYLSLSQPSLAAVKAGDSLHVVLWHGDLVFEAPAVAHVAVTVDGNIVWEDSVDIPAEAEIYDLRIPIGFEAPAGSKVEYHLHNHGFNSWTLLALEVER